MDPKRKYEAILGGLVHDIGKFFQRACRSEEELSDVSRGLESTICKVYEGRYTHRHVLFTNEFCDRHLRFLPGGMDRNAVGNLAMFHHRPSTEEQGIIQLADVLSSGMEREENEEGTTSPSSFRRVRLRSILGQIRLAGREGPKETNWVHSLAPLRPRQAFPFVVEKEPAGGDLTGEYLNLWTNFVSQWDKNRVNDPWGFVNRALSVLEHYTWCIPSATNVFPDISLFDHLKTTAAIAACLCEGGRKKEPFLLVATDFAGIQKYIFSIRTGAGGLARRLRARSFFVSLVGDAVVHRILRRLDLPMTNCLISSGGKSYLLLPNTEQALMAAERARSEMDRWALDETRGEIRVNMGMVSLASEELKDFSSAIERVNGELRNSKLRPMRDCLQSGEKWADFKDLVKPLAIAADGGLCACCQKEGGTLRLVREKMVPICARCNEDQEIGRHIPRANFIAFYEGRHGRFQLPFGSFDLADSAKSLASKPYLLFSMNGYSEMSSELPFAAGYRARYVPRDQMGELKTFEEIADSAEGRKRLGYLKSDVDNLGYIFANGLRSGDGADRTSISRLTTLSRSLDLFFSGYFEDLLAKDFPDMYTIYSGGDDLVCVGPWNQVFDLALKVRQVFEEYSCRNPAWTMSTGVALVGSREPVMSAVGKADELLTAGKEIAGQGILPWPCKSRGEPQKDRFTAFGTSVPWRHFADLLDRCRWLGGLLQSGVLNSSRVRRLLRYAEMFRAFQRTGDTRHFRYAPLLAYDLRRNWSAEEKHGGDTAHIRWAQQLLVPESPEMSKVRFVCEYALNIVREKEDGNG